MIVFSTCFIYFHGTFDNFCFYSILGKTNCALLPSSPYVQQRRMRIDCLSNQTTAGSCPAPSSTAGRCHSTYPSNIHPLHRYSGSRERMPPNSCMSPPQMPLQRPGESARRKSASHSRSGGLLSCSNVS